MFLENLTSDIDKWTGQDPVRPELSDEFRTSKGREVFGLRDEEDYKSFLCVAYTTDIPRDVAELDELSEVNANIAVPYAVWSHQRGAGREIVLQVSSFVRENRGVERVITLSPMTEMAHKFHVRNGATEIQVNETTTNFEYEVCE